MYYDDPEACSEYITDLVLQVKLLKLAKGKPSKTEGLLSAIKCLMMFICSTRSVCSSYKWTPLVTETWCGPRVSLSDETTNLLA